MSDLRAHHLLVGRLGPPGPQCWTSLNVERKLPKVYFRGDGAQNKMEFVSIKDKNTDFGEHVYVLTFFHCEGEVTGMRSSSLWCCS